MNPTTALQITATPAQPTVTTTSTVDSWTVHLGPVTATIRYSNLETESWSTIFVSDDLAESIDPQLADLATQERQLGDDRWSPRGDSTEIDDLYDRLNARIATIKTMITVAVLPKLGSVLDDHRRLLDKVEFDAYAGCTTCKCSPGVKAPYANRHGAYLFITIEPA